MADVPPTGDRPEPSAPESDAALPSPDSMGVSEPPATEAAASSPEPPPAAPAPPVQPPASGWQTAPSDETEVPGAPGHFFAATVTRVAALLIDSIAVGIVAFAVGFVLSLAAAVVSPDSFDSGTLDETSSAADVMLGILLSLAGLAASYLYFVLLWRSAAKATIGQRAFRMQVGNAFDGATLTWSQATIRWLALFGLGILAAIPVLAGLGGLAILVWMIVLLATTATSPTKQGLHDRWAGSAVVATGSQNTTLAWGCLLAYVIGIALLFVVAFAAVVAFLAAYGGFE